MTLSGQATQLRPKNATLDALQLGKLLGSPGPTAFDLKNRRD